MTLQQLTELQNLIVGSATTVLLLCLPFLGRWGAKQVMAVLARNHLVEFAKVAVLAAEQLGLSQQIKDKKAYAVRWLADTLAGRGIWLPVAEIEAAIEAAVFSELNAP